MNHRGWSISFAFLLLAGCLNFGLAHGNTQELKLNQISQNIYDGQQYVGGFPLADPNPRGLRDRFLASKNGLLLYINPLSKGLQGALWLEQLSRSNGERDQADEAIGTALRLLLQGWNYAGNLALLDGLRVSYLNANSSLSSKILVAPPSCFPDLVKKTVQISDLCMAQGFFEQGLRLVLNTLANRTPAQSPLLVMDAKPLLGERYMIEETDKEGNKIKMKVAGWFDNDKVPQYTHYDVLGTINGKKQIVKVVPILTEGYQIGQILQKYHQTVQTIAQREWGAASFDKDMKENTRNDLRDQGVRTLYTSAHHAFLADLAFAAQTSDQPGPTEQSPYREARLNAVREATESSRETIRRIRGGKKPTLPIEDIVAQVVLINDKIKEIKDGNGIGSINRATMLHDETKKFLNDSLNASTIKVKDNEVRLDMISNLRDITGIQVSPESLRENGQQQQFIRSVQQRIRLAMEQGRDWKYGQFDNELDERLAEFVRVNLRRESKLVMLQGIREKLGVINQRATTARNIREQTSENIRALHATLGILNQMPTFSFPGGVSYDHFAIPKEDVRNNMEAARDREAQRIDEANTEEMLQSLQIDIKEVMSGIDELDFEVKQATRRLQQLLGRVENLLNRLNNFEEQVAQLWYNDPTVISAVSIQEERANQAQDFLVANLYRLGKMLEFRWREPFSNPINCRGKSELLNANGAYNNFFDLEGVFALGSVQVGNRLSERPSQLAEDFYKALEAWDKKLQECRKSISPEEREVTVSLRQDIKGWRDIKQEPNGKWVQIDTRSNNHVYQSNLERFHTWLRDNRIVKAGNNKDLLHLIFSMDHHTRKYEIKERTNELNKEQIIPHRDLNSWNYHVKTIEISIKSINGKYPLGSDRDAIAHIAQDGIIYNYSAAERRRSSSQLDYPPWKINLENYVDYKYDLSLSELGQYFLAETNAFVDSFGPLNVSTRKLMWSPYCSKWILQIVSKEIDIDNIDDIELKIKYSYGVPEDNVHWL